MWESEKNGSRVKRTLKGGRRERKKAKIANKGGDPLRDRSDSRSGQKKKRRNLPEAGKRSRKPEY